MIPAWQAIKVAVFLPVHIIVTYCAAEDSHSSYWEAFVRENATIRPSSAQNQLLRAASIAYKAAPYRARLRMPDRRCLAHETALKT